MSDSTTLTNADGFEFFQQNSSWEPVYLPGDAPVDRTTYEGAVTELYEALNNLSISLDKMIPALNLIYWSFNSTDAELEDLRGELEYLVSQTKQEGCTSCGEEPTIINRTVDINELITGSLEEYERANETYFDSSKGLQLAYENVLARMQETRTKLETLEAEGKISHDVIDKHDQAVLEYKEAYQKLKASLENTSSKLDEINEILDIIKVLQGSRFPKEADSVINYNSEIVLTQPDFASKRAHYLEGENVTINFRVKNNFPYNVSVVGFLYDTADTRKNVTTVNRSYSVVCDIKGNDAVVSNFTYPADFTGVHDVRAVFYYLDEEINRFRTLGYAELNYTILPYHNHTEILRTLNETTESLRATQTVFEEVTKPVPSDIDYNKLPHRPMNATPREPSFDFVEFKRPILAGEYPISPEVRDIARQLNYDPQLIYSWVKEFEYQPYYGLMKGTEWAIHERAGNDFDQANVLVELLRASDIPAYFVYGTVEMPVERARLWLDVRDINETIETFQKNGIPAKLEGDNLIFEHIWVEAYIPFEDGSRWMPLDPSFNIVEREPIEVEFLNASTQFNGSELITTYAVKKLNLSGIEEALNETAIEEMPAAKLELAKVYSYTPLNFTIHGRLGTWGELPRKYMHNIYVGLYEGGNQIFEYNASVFDAALGGIYLDFVPTSESEGLIREFGGLNRTPPYLVEVTPRLWADGTVVGSGNPVPLGEVYNLRVGFNLPEQDYFEKNIVTGGSYALVLSPGRMPVSLVEKRSMRLDITDDAAIESLEKQLLGMIFFSIADTGYDVSSEKYLLKWWRTTPGTAIVSNGVRTTALGKPLLQNNQGITLDVRRDIISVSSLPEQISPSGTKLAFVMETGMDMSRYEAWTMMLVTNSSSVSTSEILTQAVQDGTQILQITNDNFDEMVTILIAPPAVIREIKKAVNNGMLVVIPQKPVTIDGWRGTGWYVVGGDGSVAAIVRKEGMQNGGLGFCITCGIQQVIEWLNTIKDIIFGILDGLDSLEMILENLKNAGGTQGALKLVNKANEKIDFIRKLNKKFETLPFRKFHLNILDALLETSVVLSHIAADDLSSGCEWEYIKPSILCDLGYVMPMITASYLCSACPIGCGSAIVWGPPAVIGCVFGCNALCYVAASSIIDRIMSFCNAQPKVNINSVSGVCSPTVEVYSENVGRHILKNARISIEAQCKGCGAPDSTSEYIGTICPTAGINSNIVLPGASCPKGRLKVKAELEGSALGGKVKKADTEANKESDMSWSTYASVPGSLMCGSGGSASFGVNVENAECVVNANAWISYLGGFDSQSVSSKGSFGVTVGAGGNVPGCDCTPNGGKVGDTYALYGYSISVPGGPVCGEDRGHDVTDIIADQCERPDDNVDPCDSCCYQIERVEDFKAVEIGVLTHGHFFDLKGLLGELSIPYEEINTEALKERPLEEIGKYRTILIPSGALYDMNADETFKEKLMAYVENGGRLIVLDQQKGEDFKTVGLDGKGWAEAFSCIFQSSYFDTYHPVLATQAGDVFDLNVDGVITEYPSNAEVIARRTIRAQTWGRSAGPDVNKPIFITYDHGKGSIMATTTYPDFSYGQGSLTEDLKLVFRDMLNWGRARGEIPSYLPGTTLEANVTVKNNFDYQVENALVIILDPDYRIARMEQVNVSLGPGEEKTIPYSWQVPENAETGIWSIETTSSAFWDRHYSNWFAVTNLAVANIMGINTDKEEYRAGDGMAITVRAQNMIATPLEARVRLETAEREKIYGHRPIKLLT
jgi:hypothetical protein